VSVREHLQRRGRCIEDMGAKLQLRRCGERTFEGGRIGRHRYSDERRRVEEDDPRRLTLAATPDECVGGIDRIVNCRSSHRPACVDQQHRAEV